MQPSLVFYCACSEPRLTHHHGIPVAASMLRSVPVAYVHDHACDVGVVGGHGMYEINSSCKGFLSSTSCVSQFVDDHFGIKRDLLAVSSLARGVL